MNAAFDMAAVIAVLATFMVIIQRKAVRALLYLIVSLLAVAVIFYTLGAPFVAALEVIIYAGAIMVLFVFVIMMLNLGPEAARQEGQWLRPATWIGPGMLGLALLAEFIYILAHGAQTTATAGAVGPKAVGVALFGPYLLCVELASLILLAGLVGVYHLGRRTTPNREAAHGNDSC
jgi:NADH-quinone oxidoreductase subunit J